MARKFPDQTVRWGIVGAGDVCEVKSAPAIKIIQDSELIAVMRRDAARARDYATRHNIGKWYADAGSLINDPAVNAIYIATPPNAHRDITLAAAAAGKPVYVEKPMARTLQECNDMLAACADHGVALYVAYYRRALPHFIKAKELLESGAIGDIRCVQVSLTQQQVPSLVSRLDNNWRVDPEIAGGGYFYDLASHQLDLLDFLLGPIESATGFAGNQAGQYAAEDIVTASWQFESGVLGSGTWCFTAAPVAETDHTVIVGSEGQISYRTFGDGKLLLQSARQERVFEYDLPTHIQQPLIATVVDDLLGRGDCPSTGVSAARTNRAMESICKTKRP